MGLTNRTAVAAEPVMTMLAPRVILSIGWYDSKATGNLRCRRNDEGRYLCLSVACNVRPHGDAGGCGNILTAHQAARVSRTSAPIDNSIFNRAGRMLCFVPG